jgi:hypothetical protein
MGTQACFPDRLGGATYWGAFIYRYPEGYLLVLVQMLDGIEAVIFGVVAVIIVADLARHTGRFNLMQGATSTCVAIGASVSNLAAGFAAEREGYGAGFILLTIIALLALAFFWIAMPETATGLRLSEMKTDSCSVE